MRNTTSYIAVIGCGNAGNNAINRLYLLGISGAETIAIDTDEKHLDLIQADKRILLAKSLTKGKGTNGMPRIGARAAIRSGQVLEEVLSQFDIIFIIAGMGGGVEVYGCSQS